MSRAPLLVKRASLTPKERQAMLDAQGGICATPGCGGGPPFIAEHVLCVALGNLEKPSVLLCRSCALQKTVQDIRQISKAKRQAKFQATGKGYAPSPVKIKSRGFQAKPEGFKHKWPKRKMRG